jgi:class 3 adenylate cyclase
MNYLRRLSRVGVTGDLSARETKHIIFLNIVGVLVLFIGIQNISLAATYLPATQLILVFMVLQVAGIAVTLFWNYRRRYRAARIWFSLVAALFLTLQAGFFGTGPRWHFFLVICIFLMFYLFPPREKFWMYLLVGIFSICFIGVEILFREHGLLENIPPAFVLQEYYFNTIGLLFCALSMGGVGYVTIKNAEEKFAREHERSESLLRNILPGPIAERLKFNPDIIAESFSETTILFVDIVGFTKLSESIEPETLVKLLNSVFSEMDDLTEKYQLEKIKTIGDSYMVVAGAPERRPDHAEAMAEMSLEIRDRFEKLNKSWRHALDFRIGIHSGPVVAGIIGKKKFSYDMWGRSVNIAARMESQGVASEIQVSAHFRSLLKDKYLFVERGAVDIKGIGEMLTYLLKGRQIVLPA